MPFRPKKIATVQPHLVTVAFTVSILNPEAVVSATRVVLGGRGVMDADVLKRIAGPDGNADLGECIKALMEESVAALAGATGASVGDLEAYGEEPPAPQGALSSNVAT